MQTARGLNLAQDLRLRSAQYLSADW